MITSLRDARIAFIGAGSMAEALIRGIIRQGIALPENISASNRSDATRLRELKHRYRISIPANDAERESLVREANVVVLAMKPKDVFNASAALKPLLNPNQLIVSLVAGLSIATMESLLGERLPIVRSMPNTSLAVGLGATGISFSSRVSSRQQELATDMFETSGIVSVVNEDKLDLVTGISGCGPAYVYYLIEALVNAGIEGGLSEEDAHQLAVQTARGAANMLADSGDSPATLRRKVSSPGGATMAAIEVLDRHQFGEGVVRAVFRATERSKEMGDEIAESCLKERQ